MEKTKNRWFSWIASNAHRVPMIALNMVAGMTLIVYAEGIVGFSFKDKLAEGITALFTVVLAISTIGLWIATRQLWQAGEKQIEVARAAATAAQQSVELTREAVELAGKTAVHQLRAYVQAHTFRVNVSADWEVGRMPIVTYVVTNNGQTPAYRVHRRDWVAMLPAGSADIPITLEEQSSHATIAPGRRLNCSLTVAKILDQEMLDALRSGRLQICLAGELQYEDVFGNIRYTRFRQQLTRPFRTQPDGLYAMSSRPGGGETT